MKEYPAGIKIIKHGSTAYVQVVRNVQQDSGSMTTKVIKSFGLATEENIRLAQQLAKDLNAHLGEPNAPCLEINPAALRSLEQGPILGVISPEITPRAWYGLYAIVDSFIVRNILTEEDLRNVIALTQPDLKTEEDRERFYQWIKDKSLREKARILIKRWYY